MNFNHPFKAMHRSTIYRFVSQSVAISFVLCSAVGTRFAHADVESAERALLEYRVADAATELRSLASAGDPRAQADLGTMMMYGVGMPRDTAGAFALFKRAADVGAEEGEIGLASWYMFGQTDREKYPNAVAVFRKYAERGQPLAQAGLGVLYTWGLGVPRDNAQAMHWLSLAADKDATAANNLGSMYLNGTGVSRDAAQALKFFEKARALGAVTAENNIGAVYESGAPGVPIDYDRALLHYRKAADANVPYGVAV
jgi:TPR repeat protein